MISVELTKSVSLGGVPHEPGSVLSLPLAFGEALIASGSAIAACPDGTCGIGSNSEGKPRKGRKPVIDGSEGSE
jgi:hypothetical protein